VCRVYLPYYINNLVHDDNITIQITNINHYKFICVKNIEIDKNYFELSIDNYDDGEYGFYWTLIAERKDINKLVVEEDKKQENVIDVKNFLLRNG
jgi:hypothetical protein